ncbi:MAG: LuxR C-terminal-related transcriptional regulator [Sulfobacillus thermotolerans]|uniref:helix-turn-helix transcriptional regulator n=1 Tax=Sulfobacillus thermotolerans TaxID=338644 RepID=UPI002275131F|nr:LuxR C-terminal-related transcriptional regulator [Sulfobacillus thermotolerans]
MTAVLPHMHPGGSSSSVEFPPGDFYWIFSRGLALRGIVSIFLWWNIMAFPGKSLPHAWLSAFVVSAADILAWLLHRHHASSVILLAVITTVFDLVLGLVVLTEFSITLASNAPALLPLIGIELIAYYNGVGYWIAVTYCSIAVLTLWPFPSRPLTSLAVSHMAFWLIVNFLVLSAAATLRHRASVVEVHDALGSLTSREREVYGLLQSGLSQREIGDQLHIERSTVKTHVQHIRQKLGLDDSKES